MFEKYLDKIAQPAIKDALQLIYARATATLYLGIVNLVAVLFALGIGVYLLGNVTKPVEVLETTSTQVLASASPTAAPTTETTPTPEPVDPWEGVYGCGPVGVTYTLFETHSIQEAYKFMRDSGRFTETPPIDTWLAWEDTPYWSFDARYVLTGTNTSNFSNDDRWENPLFIDEAVDSLEEIPLPTHDALVLGIEGSFGHINTKGSKVTNELLCGEDSLEDISWTPLGNLDLVVTSTIHHEVPGYGFHSAFFIGRSLSFLEKRHVYIECLHQKDAVSYIGAGFIGGSTSLRGRYHVVYDETNEEWDLTWKSSDWVSMTQTYKVMDNIPLDREIVVHTQFFWDNKPTETKEQRFVLSITPWGLQMLEPAEKPSPIWDIQTRSSWGLDTMPEPSAPPAYPNESPRSYPMPQRTN